MNTRFLGMVTIASSAIILLDSLRQVALGNEEVFDTAFTLTMMFWAIGGITALVGMVQLDALGRNTVVRALAFVPIIGFLLLVLAGIAQLAGLTPAEDNMLAGVGWLVQMAGMVLVGILNIAAGIWRGWRRFLPLATIVVAPLSLAIGNAIDNLVLATVLVYGCWIVLGYVVATGETVLARPAGVAA